MRHQGRYLLGGRGPIAPGEELGLAGSEARHLLLVRRARPGDRLEVSDGAGRAWLVELISAEGDTARCRVHEELPGTSRPKMRLSVATAVPRAKRMSFLVEKCAELGVEELLPVTWARSERRISPPTVERWRRLAGAAAKQSRRSTLMHVTDPVTPRELADRAGGYARILLLDPGAEEQLAGALEPAAADARVLAAIGPEGGFAADDLHPLESTTRERLSRVSLGDAILRVETAAVALAALALACGAEAGDG
jgi:16S rRNA (uracil1498-N3)-methyltransferase